ncbi:hypothetical protein WA158_006330 [Blastocystis sp. Blastoise]
MSQVINPEALSILDENKENAVQSKELDAKKSVKRTMNDVLSPLSTVKKSRLMSPISNSKAKSNLFKDSPVPDLLNQVQFWQNKYGEKNDACKKLEESMTNYWKKLEELKSKLSKSGSNTPHKSPLSTSSSPGDELVRSRDSMGLSVSNRPEVNIDFDLDSALNDSFKEIEDSLFVSSPNTPTVSSSQLSSSITPNSLEDALQNTEEQQQKSVQIHNNINSILDITKNCYEGISNLFDTQKIIENTLQKILSTNNNNSNNNNSNNNNSTTVNANNVDDIDIETLPQYISLLNEYKGLQEQYNSLTQDNEYLEEMKEELVNSLKECTIENDQFQSSYKELLSKYEQELSSRNEFELLYTASMSTTKSLEETITGLEQTIIELTNKMKEKDHIIKHKVLETSFSHAMKMRDSTFIGEEEEEKEQDKTIRKIEENNDDKQDNEQDSFPSEVDVLKEQIKSLQFANQVLMQRLRETREGHNKQINYFQQKLTEQKQSLNDSLSKYTN